MNVKSLNDIYAARSVGIDELLTVKMLLLLLSLWLLWVSSVIIGDPSAAAMTCTGKGNYVMDRKAY